MCVPRCLDEVLGVARGFSSTPIVTGSTMDRAVSSSFCRLQENISRLSTVQWRVLGMEEVDGGERKLSTSVPLRTTALEEEELRSSTTTKSVSVTLRPIRTSRSG